MTRENLTYTVLKLQPEVKKDYRQKDYAFWTHYLNYIVFGDELPTELNQGTNFYVFLW